MPNESKLNFAGFIELLKATGKSFGEDKVSRLAAALAYFTVFALSPLFVLAISIGTMFFGDDAARGEIASRIQATVGDVGAKAIEEMLQNANQAGKTGTIVGTIVGLLVALWGASGYFGSLQDALNTIWGVAPKPDAGFKEMVRDRFVSFAMVLGIVFLLLVSLILSTALNALTDWLALYIGSGVVLAKIVNFLLGLLISTLLFMAIFKILPDAEIQWRDVFIGGAVTALLFSIGRLILAWYLSKPSVGSPYGSAGALVVLLLWINYASTILLIGAEFTKAYANKFGSRIQPSAHAMAVTEEARAREGLAPQQSHAAVDGAPQKDGKRDTNGKVRIMEPALSSRQMAEVKRKDAGFSTAVVLGGAIVSLFYLWRNRGN